MTRGIGDNYNKVHMPHLFEPIFQKKRFKAFHGGRGSGKSHNVAAYVILECLREKQLWLCAREIQHTIADSVYRLLVNKIYDFGVEHLCEIKATTIVFHNGSEIIFVGLRHNPEGIKSKEGFKGVWVEEAEKVSQRSIEMLTPTLRLEDSEIIFTWNRRYKEDPVDNMFLGGEPPPDSIVQRVCWRDNPYFPHVLFKELKWLKKRDYDKYLHVWEGYPLMNSEARVFPNKKWSVVDMDHALPADAVPYLGADWGYSVDPTVLVEVYRWERTLYIRRERWAVHLELDDIPAMFAGDDWQYPPRWLNKFGETGFDSVREGFEIRGDRSRADTVSYLKNHGLNIKGSDNSAGSVKDGIEFILNHENIFIHPSCRHVIDEFGTYSYKVDPQTDRVLRPAVLEDKKNHTVDSVRYAVEDIRKHEAKTAGVVESSILQNRSIGI